MCKCNLNRSPPPYNLLLGHEACAGIEFPTKTDANMYNMNILGEGMNHVLDIKKEDNARLL